MEMKHDGVNIYCLPDGARCCADDKERCQLDLDVCPIGNEECDGDCEFYEEYEDEPSKEDILATLGDEEYHRRKDEGK